MPKIRAEKTGKWVIGRHEFYAAYHFALQYPEWCDRLKVLTDSVGAIQTDGMPHGNMVGNPTQNLAIQRAEISQKIELVESAAKEATSDCDWMYDYLMRAVTSEGITFVYLKTVMEIPCGKDMYYDRRRKFYYLLNKKLFER